MTNSFTGKTPFYFICHLSCFVPQCFKQLVWGRLLSEIKWRVKQHMILRREEKKKKQYSKRTALFPHWSENNFPYHSTASWRVHSQFAAPPYPAQGISMCVHKYWAVRWKRVPLHSWMGVPALNAWVTDYFLTSLNHNSLKRRGWAAAWRGRTRNKGFPNNTQP